MLTIDGALKSGSGTIVRYAISLASLLAQDLHLINIRAKRDKPGLRRQHLRAISACNEITDGTLENAAENAQKITYYPGKQIKAGEYAWDIGTAGSTTMLAQTILPLGCFAPEPSSYQITGGLFQDFAPAAHHLQHVVIPLLASMGINIELEIIKPGYVPRGGGIIALRIQPVTNTIKPLILTTQGKITAIKGIALASNLQERNVSGRMAEACNNALTKYGYAANIECIDDTTALQRGASLTVYAQTDTGCIIGADCAGKLGRTAENIGNKVATMLVQDLQSDATVDRHTADQLILYAALASGTSKYLIPHMTEHIDTNLWLVNKILGVKHELKNNLLTIHGVGFKYAKNVIL